MRPGWPAARPWIVVAWLGVLAAPALAGGYVPPRGAWETRTAEDAGFDPARLDAAVNLASKRPLQSPRTSAP